MVGEAAAVPWSGRGTKPSHGVRGKSPAAFEHSAQVPFNKYTIKSPPFLYIFRKMSIAICTYSGYNFCIFQKGAIFVGRPQIIR